MKITCTTDEQKSSSGYMHTHTRTPAHTHTHTHIHKHTHTCLEHFLKILRATALPEFMVVRIAPVPYQKPHGLQYVEKTRYYVKYRAKQQVNQKEILLGKKNIPHMPSHSRTCTFTAYNR